MIGAISQATTDLRLGTAVTCLIVRIHPTITAQAAATAVAQLLDRFFLAFGTGETRNEHVEAIRGFVDVEFDHVAVHNIGPTQAEFVESDEDEVLLEGQ
ncbi:LLM class flavin-dependent oxidoreductase [Natronococcus pandeyae]|uniref:LLM class flavin-dependent oxidoreductase n=1 Tax=Natronococcus pandeyae TaxID=2055836 RepID=UPI0037436528